MDWRDTFEGFEPTAFPDLTGRSPLASRKLKGRGTARYETRFQSGALRTHCEESRVSLAAVLQAAWVKVLAAYTGETDLCSAWVSTTSALPIRIKLNPLTSNKELVDHVQGRWAHDSFQEPSAVEEVQKLLQPDCGPLFDTGILFLDGLTGAHSQDPSSRDDIPILLEVILVLEESLHIALHYQRSLILNEDTTHVFAAFEASLESVLQGPCLPALSLSSDPCTPPRSVSNCNYKPAESLVGSLVHQFVETHARERPDHIALDFLESNNRRTKWTFATLDRLASRLANLLITDYQVKAEDSIPICVPKSPAFYACVLGVLKAGATFTPFSDSPNERKKLMLEELGSKVCLYTYGEEMTWCSSATTINVSAVLSDLSLNQKDVLKTSSRPHLEPSNLAYQMYTSGSTGRPKAVSISHSNAVQTVAVSRKLVPWDNDSRMLQYAAPSFDMCFYDTFLAWHLGICLCSASSEAVYNDLTGVINSLDITMLGLTPSVALTLDPQDIPSVRWLYCIGEAMPQSLVDTWPSRLSNSYGPTEATQMVTLFPVDSDVKAAVLGKPFPSTSFYVLQKNTNDLAPVLALGELYIGGLQVARGYLADEERTRQSFVERGGVRLYRSGDDVRMLGNGNFEFIGRTDDQVKIRGQRVELGEINKALRDSHFAIRQATSQILKITESSTKQLAAFFVLEDKTDGQAVRQAAERYLHDHLPAFMIPRCLIPVDHIPLSHAGKVDKKVLQKLLQESGTALGDGGTDSQESDSWTKTEETVRQIFATVAGMETINIRRDTTIYQIGLDSIGAITIGSKLKKAGHKADASDVLDRPSVAELAALLENRDGASALCDSDTPAFDFAAFDAKHRHDIISDYKLSQGTIDAVRPCSPSQAGMIATSIHSSGNMYFNHLTYKCPKDLDNGNLLNAWSVLLEKYEVLRSGFCETRDPRYPLAMVTYKRYCTEIPIEFVDEPVFNIKDWQQRMTQNALESLLWPPWRVLVAPGNMYISAHHALYDAQVLDLLMRDLAAAYEGTSPNPATSFEPYLARTLNTSDQAQHSSLSFWSGLSDQLHVCRFPTMTPTKVEKKGIHKASRLCSVRLAELEICCRKYGVTMQAAGQAAWAYVLAAYSGEPMVTFGTVLSGRTFDSSNDLCFPCITTIPTPANTSMSVTNLLEDLRSFSAKAQPHQFVPLKQIKRITGHTNEALFDTIFTLQKKSSEVPASNVFQFVDNDLTIDMPVSIELAPIKDELEIRVHHHLDRVPREQAWLLIDQFDMLLRDILSGQWETTPPNVADVDHHLYSIIPAQIPSLPSNASFVHQFVEIGALKYPHRIALEFVLEISGNGMDIRKKTWTYEALDKEGNRVANLLQQHNVPQGSIVAICFDKCPEVSFAMLGILKAGCSFLALDSRAPKDRKEFIIKDSHAAALLTKGALVKDLSLQICVSTIQLDEVDLAKVSSSCPKLDRSLEPQDLCYCLYTSGTTGVPKGCSITHENTVQVFASFEKLYKRTNNSRWLQFAGYHFDVSVMEHFWSWSVGICVVAASRDLILADLPRTIEKLQITHIDLTPSLARLLDPEDVPSLADGVFVMGGEALKQEIIDKFGSTGAIHNAYGPTEATICVSMYPHVPQDGRPSNIGWQLPNVGTFVVNPQNPQVPVLKGGVGELCVSGLLVAKGYIGRPEQTAKSFIEISGQRSYRTGDLVRILHDGSIDFIGRADDQVKLRGQRLEIGEINSVIKQRSSAVFDVSTHVLKHPNQQKEQLVAFVVTQPPSNTHNSKAQIVTNTRPVKLLADLKAACQEKLPPYMVPTHILAIETMPLSTNNKGDAKQLKAMYEGISFETLQELSDNRIYDTASVLLPEQETITNVLSETLGIGQHQIAPNLNFFEAGLDSISIIGFVKRLRTAGLTGASTVTIMEHASVNRLAYALTDKSRNHGKAEDDSTVQAARQTIRVCENQYKTTAAKTLSVVLHDIEAIAPCTPLQQGIISRSLQSANGTYFSVFHFDIEPNVDIMRLHSAFQRVVDNVPILRTRFVSTDDGNIQVVLRTATLPWHEEQVSSRRVEQWLYERHQDWWQRNTDVLLEPVLVLISHTSECTILSIHIFHACYDGYSIPLLLENILGEYNSTEEVDYGPSFLDILPYGPLREMKQAKSFWLEHLAPFLGLNLYRLRIPAEIMTDGTSASTRMRPISIARSIEPIPGFESCRRSLNVTHQAILQACWVAVLQDAASMPLALGLIVSGRSIDFKSADRVIGPVFNTVPFILNLTEQDCWRDVVARCHHFNSSSLPFQHTPLRDIQKWAREHRADVDTRLFSTLFVFQRHMMAEHYHTPLWRFRNDKSEVDYPLSIDIEQADDGTLNVTLTAQSGVITESRAYELLRKLEATLRLLVDDVAAPIVHSVRVYSVAGIDRSGNDSAQMNGYTNGRGNGHTNGHADRKFNSLPDGQQPPATGTNQMQIIRNEIADLANVDSEQLSSETSILELGLDSVDAVMLSSRLRRATGIQLPVSRIMRLLTIGNIGAAIAEKSDDGVPTAPGDGNQDLQQALKTYIQQSGMWTSNIHAILPSTPLQEGIVAGNINSDYKQYFNHDVLRIHPRSDLQRLKAAFQEVVNNTPILRTRFVEVTEPSLESTLAQVILKPEKLAWREDTIPTGNDFVDIFDAIRQEVAQDAGARPPLRLSILSDYENQHRRYIILSMSHALYDGWSLALMHGDIKQAYHGRFEARRSFEPVLWKILNASDGASQSFWRQLLQDVASSIVPSRRAHQEAQPKIHRAERTCGISRKRILAFCKQYHVTLAAFTQTVWSFVLATYTRQLDVIFGLVLSGRDDETASDILFPIMNTVLARTILRGTRKEMIQNTQNSLIDISAYRQFPLRTAIVMAKTTEPADLFNTLFVHQRNPRRPEDEAENLYESVGGASDVEYSICVEAELMRNGLLWRVACKDDYRDNQGTKMLLDDLEAVAKAVVQDPEGGVVSNKDGHVSICGLQPFREQRVQRSRALSMKEPTPVSDLEHWDPMESHIRDVVANVARIDKSKVRKHSSLISLGLDSISAIKVSSLLQRISIKITVNQIIQAGTISNMAKTVKQLKEGASDGLNKSLSVDPQVALPAQELIPGPISYKLHDILRIPYVEKEDIELVLPATAGQVYMLSKWQTQGLFLPTIHFNVSGGCDLEQVLSAWATLASQTPILRTIFVATGDSNVPILQVVLKDIANANGSSTKPTPTSLTTYKTNAGHVEIALTLSHALYDGFSLLTLFDRFKFILGHHLPDNSLSSNDFGSVLRQVQRGQSSRKTFWTNYLSMLHQKSLQQSGPTNRRLHIVEPDTISEVVALTALARKQGLTIQTVFLAAYAATYATIVGACKDDEILLGLYVANRDLEGADVFVAPTLGFVPVRVKNPLQFGLVDLARQIQRDLSLVTENGRGFVGLWELQDWLGPSFRVDTWVNLVKDKVESETDTSEDGPQIKFDFREQRKRKDQIYDVNVRDDDETHGLFLGNNVVKDAYKDSIDIDVTISRSSMDIGVLASESLLDREGARSIVKGLRTRLGQFMHEE